MRVDVKASTLFVWEIWKTGKLENWKTGKLENWKTKVE
ncbi:hypothetical protein VITU9109_16283 [Vibrio tubiashii ATCC 19109]|uniref:Uncharacterized protein n=1 Tax=Vibrio tubiashii ATCC 19109 TaxID=1051646 RepID=A0ABP2LGQ3_9VIBR|nr:hypothetical protein VITU9109_16283 [Vibrio tubiashii ATCC 19109]